MSWQSGGEQRMAFPPWKPVFDLSKNMVPGDDQKIEMGVILQQLNALKKLCTTGVGLKPFVLVHTLCLTTFCTNSGFQLTLRAAHRGALGRASGLPALDSVGREVAMLRRYKSYTSAALARR
jgi:hypothetical protein